jgi:hypothetical protein
VLWVGSAPDPLGMGLAPWPMEHQDQGEEEEDAAHGTGSLEDGLGPRAVGWSRPLRVLRESRWLGGGGLFLKVA